MFISYSNHDQAVADAACAALEAGGIRCWIAHRDVAPGGDWAASIVAAIRGAQITVLIFSRNANQSTQVQREVERATSFGKVLLTLRIDGTRPEDAFEYYLGTSQWLDATAPPFEAHLTKLVNACAGWLGTGYRPPGTGPQTPPPTPPPPTPAAGTATAATGWAFVGLAAAVALTVVIWAELKHHSPSSVPSPTTSVLQTSNSIDVQPAPAVETTAASAAAEVPGIGPFVGSWAGSRQSVTIDTSGNGNYYYQNFDACPNCSMAQVPYARIYFVLTSVSDGVAGGQVTVSPDPQSFVVGGSVTLSTKSQSFGETLTLTYNGKDEGTFCIANNSAPCGY